MTNRWSILAVLFLARMTMAFQFQSVASVSPFLTGSLGLSLADVGLMIGLYMAPGLVVAIPGGAVAARFGDKRVVGVALVLMLLGSALMALAPSWNAMVAGRLMAGVGGVILNVLITKMVVDWFAGREISTALSIMVNAWPVGIALALLTLPHLAGIGGVALAWWFVTGTIGLALALYVPFYRAPPGAAAPGAGLRLAGLPVYPLLLAASIWALYNTALAMVFSFGPVILTEKGWTAASAGSLISAFMVVFAIALPLGGVLADRTGRRDTIILTSMLGFSVLMPLVIHAPPTATVVVFMVVGILFALAAGPVMTLPSLVLPPAARGFGMGVFFTVYYISMMVAPRIVGGAADRAGNSGVAILCAVLMTMGCVVALLLFRVARVGRPSAG